MKSPFQFGRVPFGHELALRHAVAALALVALCTAVGFSKVHYPLVDDQTLYLRGAEVIRDGGTLYRDFWDIKPPGLFLVYFAGGKLFGFTDLGIRLIEVLFLVCFAAVAFLSLKSEIRPRAAWLGALLTVVFYYFISDESDLGNVEGLACLPAALAAFGLLVPRSKWRLVLAGLGVGLLVLLKPFYGAIGVAFWLVLLVGDRNAPRLPTLAALMGSAAVPIVATVVWFALRRALPELFNTVFQVPYEARFLIDPMKRLPVLSDGFRHFWGGISPIRWLLLPAVWA